MKANDSSNDLINFLEDKTDEKLTVKRVAYILHKTPSSVYRLLGAKQLEATLTGTRGWLIARSSLEKYLKKLNEPK